eukprot:jgi/Mesen1/2622/ME000166S01747
MRACVRATVCPSNHWIKKEFARDILPPFHPLSVLVRAIAANTIRAALQNIDSDGSRGSPELGAESGVHPGALIPSHSGPHKAKPRASWGDEDDPEAHPPAGEEKYLTEKFGHKHAEEDWSQEGLREDDQWLSESRSRGLAKGQAAYVAHLRGLEWEVLVVDRDVFNAFCLPGGKIVVFTGLLKHLPKPIEIATVLGHEVGHVVARHSGERMTSGMFLLLLELVALQFVDAPRLITLGGDLLFTKPFSRLHEIEADRIGLILMAAAGYDPLVAPGVYSKMESLHKSPQWADFINTHPSGRRRAELLSHADVMREALQVYEGSRLGQSHRRLLM